MTQEEIIRKITSTIEDAVASFVSGTAKSEATALNKIIDLTKDLIIPANTDGDVSKNLSMINRIKEEVNTAVFSDGYQAKLGVLLKSFDEVESLIESYFMTIKPDFSTTKILSRIKTASINLTVDQLTENGINANISNDVKDLLMRNVVSGASYSDLVTQIKTSFTGKLIRYADTIATDSLNTYAATYMQLVTDDLGLVWFKLVGSIKITSREWCIKAIEAKAKGQEYIHISQFADLAAGYILGKRVKISKTTGLPYGFKAGTNSKNLFINRGGWACGHQFYPVSEAVVPKKLIDKFK